MGVSDEGADEEHLLLAGSRIGPSSHLQFHELELAAPSSLMCSCTLCTCPCQACTRCDAGIRHTLTSRRNVMTEICEIIF